MAQINLRVKTDLAKASAELKKFGNLSEAEAKRIEGYAKSFKTGQIDKFIDKNRRLVSTFKGTRGETEALRIGQNDLQRKMETLIKRGLDPQSDEVQRLKREYDKLGRESEQLAANQKALGKVNAGINRALKVGAVAAGAAAVATAKLVGDTAKLGDQYAKTSKRVGVGVEALQELSFAAERQGMNSEELVNSFERLNNRIGKLRTGTGELTSLLKEQNPELLKQLETANDTEDAFNILVGGINNASDQFEKAALAQAAFGRSGQAVINIASAGADGIADLREEARQLGVIDAETARQSEAFADAQANLNQAFVGVRHELAGEMLPAMTDMIKAFTDFISDGDKVKDLFDALVPALSAAAAGLITFKAVSVATTVSAQGLAVAAKAMWVAMTGPAGLAAAAVAALVGVGMAIRNSMAAAEEANIERLKSEFDGVAESTNVAADNMDEFISKAEVVEGSFRRAFEQSELKDLPVTFDSVNSRVEHLAESLGLSKRQVIEIARQNEDLSQGYRDQLDTIEQQIDARLEEKVVTEANNFSAIQAQLAEKGRLELTKQMLERKREERRLAEEQAQAEAEREKRQERINEAVAQYNFYSQLANSFDEESATYAKDRIAALQDQMSAAQTLLNIKTKAAAADGVLTEKEAEILEKYRAGVEELQAEIDKLTEKQNKAGEDAGDVGEKGADAAKKVSDNASIMKAVFDDFFGTTLINFDNLSEEAQADVKAIAEATNFAMSSAGASVGQYFENAKAQAGVLCK